jgi:hypothetical protein
MSDPLDDPPIPDPVEVAMEAKLAALGLGLPTDRAARFNAVEAARAAGLDRLTPQEMRRRHESVWGFREVARELGISWRLAAKWAREGRLPVLPQGQWVKGPVTVYRQAFQRTPLGLELAGTTPEARIVDKVFDATAIKAVDVDAIRAEIAAERAALEETEE